MTSGIQRATGTYGTLKSADEAQFENFCVVVPMYNEAEGARACVEAITTEIATISPRPILIAVDDGSKDDTPALLDALRRSNPRLVVVHKNDNEGYGAALQTGAETGLRLGFDYAIFMDSDLTNDPKDIAKFLPGMHDGYDVIKASRFMRGGAMAGVPFSRGLISRLGNVLGRTLFGLGIHDVTNGFRAVRLALLAKVSTTERGFSSIVEELCELKRLGATFTEVPVVLTSRSAALRPTAFAYRPSTFLRYFKYCLRAFKTRGSHRA